MRKLRPKDSMNWKNRWCLSVFMEFLIKKIAPERQICNQYCEYLSKGSLISSFMKFFASVHIKETEKWKQSSAVEFQKLSKMRNLNPLVN